MAETEDFEVPLAGGQPEDDHYFGYRVGVGMFPIPNPLGRGRWDKALGTLGYSPVKRWGGESTDGFVIDLYGAVHETKWAIITSDGNGMCLIMVQGWPSLFGVLAMLAPVATMTLADDLRRSAMPDKSK